MEDYFLYSYNMNVYIQIILDTYFIKGINFSCFPSLTNEDFKDLYTFLHNNQ